MNRQRNQILTLGLALQESYLPVVIPFVETAAAAFGLGKNECLSLGLASEEIFSHLCRQVTRDEDVEVRCRNGIHYTRVEFRFPAAGLNLGGLNITAAPAGEDEASMEDMGLMIAARSVDRLEMTAEKDQRVCLAVEKGKEYPPVPEEPFASTATTGEVAVGVPDSEGVKEFALLANRHRTDPLMPLFLRYPGKVADMVAGGEYQILTVADARQEIAGGILYCFPTDRMVETFGPYVRDPADRERIAEKLLEACISRVARTKVIGIVNRTGLPERLRSNFEILGTRMDYGPEGEPVGQPCFYRMLHEDPGCVVWTHTDLKGYLEGEYGRLFLAREVKVVRDFGETRSGASIFSAEIRRERLEVVLRPLWPGADFDINVERHIHRLRAEHLANLFFELDLGVSWHAALIPALLNHSFRPVMVLPFAGRADLAVFQHHAD